MNPLYRNDRPGEFPLSYYAATADIPPVRPSLDGDVRADVAILGAGYCGLWAALTCARAGLRVVVLEAHRAGFGASGRNGGQVGSVYNKDLNWLDQRVGQAATDALFQISEEGKAQLRQFCEDHAPNAQYKPGIAHGGWNGSEVDDLHADAEALAERYGYDALEFLDGPAFRDIVKSEVYKGGTLDMGAGHIHPLNYAIALAREAEAAGAVIHELTEVTKIETENGVRMHTNHGVLSADHGIVAGNGYLPNIVRKVAARTMPINSFIAATEPLGARALDVLTKDIAVADDRFVVNYFRLSEDKRLLFGGRENYSLGFPTDIGTRLRQRMESLFPQISGIGVDYTWGGTLGITTHRLPYLTRLGPTAMSAGGFSGHGVSLAGMAGRVMGEAMLGQAKRFDVLEKLPCPAFPGGAAFRAPLLTLAMAWYAMRDRLGV